jgi:mannonate dehydratase
MRIVEAKVVVTCPGRNFVTLKLTTDEGVTGLGDATLNGRELAVAAYLRDHVVPLLVGRDAHRIGDLWQYLYKGAYWRRGPVTMTAIAAVDVALWDIKGKVAGLPVYQLLGGRARERVQCYGHAGGETIEDCLGDVQRFVDEGYRAVRVQCGVPGLPATYGVGHGPGPYEPAEVGAAPPETIWATPPYLDVVPRLFAAARERFGADVALLHDVHHRLTPMEAARLGESLLPYDPFWIEDPTPAENQRAFEVLRAHTSAPIAVGEVLTSIWDCQELIVNQWIDYIRTTVVHAGGITHLRRILDLADLYQVRSGSHGATDLSPVSMAAALHVDVSIPNFGIQEYLPHAPETEAVFPHGWRFERGDLYVSEQPGLGVELDEEAAEAFPYRPAYLPVNRLLDGTVHSW